jgi:hypothetical protein
MAGAAFADNGADNHAQAPKELVAFRLNGNPPVVDGDLNEAVWTNPDLPKGRGFIQRNPDDGALASESTVVAIVYGEHSIFIAAWCYDSEPDKIVGELVRRDRSTESDIFGVRIDGFHDHQTGYGFRVSAAGVLEDWRLYNDGWSDSNWDGVWTGRVKMHPWGWSVEMEIPFYCLRFPDAEEQTWGLNFSRNIPRTSEDNWWSPISNSVSGFTSNFGHLTGLKGIKPARHFEVQPYVVSAFETEREGAANIDGRDYYGNLGVDLKYGLSSNLILDATVNPDFGQVELDEPVLNLSTYETYFGERRPFFVEGSDLFQSEFDLFYSRRIGRAPGGDVEDDNFVEYTSRGSRSTTILGAAKLTGKLAGGTSIALLTAVTEEEKRKYRAEVARLGTTGDTIRIDTLTREGVVEPMAGYSALRIQQDLFERSYVGATLTLASQDRYHPAVTGGFDWRLFTTNRLWSLYGQTVFSRIDAEEAGFGFDVTLGKESGKHFVFALGSTIKDPYLDLNRLGYLSRPDERAVWAWFQYKTDDDWWIVRDSWHNVNLGYGKNYRGEEIRKSWNFNNSIQFLNNWSAGINFGENIQEYDDRETRGHGTWVRPESWYFGSWLDTDARRMFQVELDYNVGESYLNPYWSAGLVLRYKPTSNFNLWTELDYVHDYNQLKWVDNDPEVDGAETEEVLFAEKDQDLFQLEFGASLTLTTALSLQFSAQGLSSGLDYHDYRPWRGEDNYGDEIAESILGSTYDYQYSALNSMFMMRWEFKPGSTLYAVWTRARWEYEPGTTGLRWDRDFGRFLNGTPSGDQIGDLGNVFLLKLNYWMNI